MRVERRRVIHFSGPSTACCARFFYGGPMPLTTALGRGDSEPPEEICGPFRKFGGNLDGDHRSSTPAVFGDT